MSYGLTRAVLDSSSFIPLSKDEFGSLMNALNNVQLVLSIEEQLDLVLSNYLELEDDLLSMSTRWMVAITPDYRYMATERNFIVNRRFLNLLNACRGYLDHTKHHLNSIRDARSYIDEFNRYASEEYDAHLGYRIMEAMRNYTQHAGFPLAVTYSTTWIGEGEDRKLRFVTRPYIQVPRVGRSLKPPRVRQELEDLGNEADIMPMVRQYVASLGDAHEKLRKLLRTDAETWDEVIFQAIQRFENEFPGEKTIGLMVVETAEDGSQKRKADVFSDPIEYRQTLEAKNRNLGTLARRYVSSESP